MKKILKRLSSVRIIALGFAGVILIGSLLLLLPISVRDGVFLSYLDALYTSASAVCVTGLVVVDIGDTFTPLGQFIIALLIQIGGLGVASVGAGIIIAVGRKVNIKGRSLIRDAMNLDSGHGIIRFLRNVFVTTVVFELAGALLSFTVFIRDFPFWRAVGISLFHSVAAFNNSGFDILGNFQSLTAYRDSVMLNLTTCALIFFGGIGFLVIRELYDKRLNLKKLSMHAKVVLTVSFVLIAAGTLLIKLTESVSWLGALFTSVSVRTAGFSIYPLGEFSKSGLLVMIVLMFIGASPGSTGGGVKTTTFFAVLQGIKSAATNKSEKAFGYSVPKEAFRKASVIVFAAMAVVTVGTYLFGIFEPDFSLLDGLFEMTSAFGTVGLSTGITPQLGTAARIVSIIIMYIGRLGPMTIATLWYFNKGERLKYPDGNIVIG